jgi:hypothetical protein
MKIVFVTVVAGVALSGVAASMKSGNETIKSNPVKKLKSTKSVSFKAAPVDNWLLDFIKTEKGEPIKLENGKYECRKTSNYNVVNVNNSYTCKNTGIPSCYGSIVAVNTGGSGYFIYLVLFNKGISVAHKFLGDRVRVKKVYFRGGQLLAEYFVHAKDQAMADVPVQAKIAKIKVDSE